SRRLANTAPVGAVEERAPSLVATLSLAAAGYLEEGLPAGDVALGVHALLAALLRLVQRLARLAEARLEVGAVERVRVHRLLDQHQRAVVHHLEVALALREPDDVRLGLVEAQLGGLQDRHQRRVVGQDADRPHARARGDHLDLVVEDLPLRGQDLGPELGARHLGSHCPDFSWASSLSSPPSPRSLSSSSSSPESSPSPSPESPSPSSPSPTPPKPPASSSSS